MSKGELSVGKSCQWKHTWLASLAQAESQAATNILRKIGCLNSKAMNFLTKPWCFFGLWVAQMGTPMNIHELPSDNWQIWGMCSIGSSRRRRHGCCTAIMAIRKVTGAMWCENQHPYVAAWWNYCKRFKEREEIYETNRKLVQDTGITWMTMIFSRLFVSIRSACSVVSPNALAMAVWASGADTAFSFKGWAHGHWHTWNCYNIDPGKPAAEVSQT